MNPVKITVFTQKRKLKVAQSLQYYVSFCMNTSSLYCPFRLTLWLGPQEDWMISYPQESWIYPKSASWCWMSVYVEHFSLCNSVQFSIKGIGVHCMLLISL